MGLGGFLPGILCLLSTVIFIKTFVDFIGGTTFLFGEFRLFEIQIKTKWFPICFGF